MQVGGVQLGGTTMPRRGRLQVVLALLVVVVITALVALLLRATPLAGSGAGADEAGASSAIIHDDPWNLRSD